LLACAAILPTALVCAQSQSQSQSQPQSVPAPAFDAATLKVAAPSERFSVSGGPGTSDPGRFTCTAYPLRVLVRRAWALKDYALAAPDSANSALYDLNAVFPPTTTKDDFNRMLQRLLQERLALVVHHETRDQPIFELIVANGGPKLKPAESAPPAASPPPAAPTPDGARPTIHLIDTKDGQQLPPGKPMLIVMGAGHGVLRMLARMQTSAAIASALEGDLQTPVIDKTGSYDFVVEYASGRGLCSPRQIGRRHRSRW
jgi:uncharacterized protein (TIGR03435 family)